MTFAIGVGATSKSIDRLEGRGWASRGPNPLDRRSSLLSLTASGAQLLEQAEPTVAQRLHELTTLVAAPAQLTGAAETLSLLRRALGHDRIGAPTG